MDGTLSNYDLEELQGMGLISRRARHVCEAYGLVDLALIHEYYLNHRSFLDLRNSGIETNVELIRLCSKYDNQIVLEEDDEAGDTCLEIFPMLQPLSQEQITVLDQYANTSVKASGQRTRNVLATFVGDHLSFVSIYRAMMERKTGVFPHVHYTGLKTKLETLALLQGIYNKYREVLGQSDEELSCRTHAEWLQKHFNLEEAAFAPFFKLHQQGSLPLFGFINYLLMHEKLMDKRETLIFKSRTGYFSGKQIEPMEKLAAHFSVSVESIRLIALRLPKKFSKGVTKLATNMEMASIVQRYDWNFGDDLLYTTSDHAERLNAAESIHFNTSFYTFILSIILADTYQLLSTQLQHDYLIKVQLFESFNFEAMIAGIADRLHKKNDRTYDLNFESYLAPFLFNNDTDLLPRIAKVCRNILEREFEGKIRFNDDGNLIFPRPSSVKIQDLAMRILDAEVRPMTLADLHERLKENPNYHLKNLSDLRNLLNRDKTVFIFFDRRSTYGLRKWEGSMEGIKGGTIRTIVEEYLEKFDGPRHIKAITEHVQQFRPTTNWESINGNLQLVTGGQFQHFPGGFWGLASKNYAPEHLIFKRLPNTIKGDTISDIVEEFLEKFDEPKHLKAIIAHVLQFKPTTNRHIVYSNLWRSKSNKFLSFPGGFWGLASKNYPPEHLVFQPLPNTIQGGAIQRIVEAYLEKFDEPKHIKAIAEHVQLFRPTTNRHTVHASLRRSKGNKFQHFPGGFWGLASKNYAPKQWEFKPLPKTIKGHTIRSIVEEFLDKFDEPKHIKAIAEHVMQFRPTTNWENIKSNLKQVVRSQFQRFPGEFWGLTSKNYPPGHLIFNPLSKNAQGGVIQNIVKAYLEAFEEPMHIATIVEHVQQFRPTTNRHNVQQNLRRSKSNKFLLFPGEFWGLASKNYAPEYSIFNPLSKNAQGGVIQNIVKAYLEAFEEPRHIASIVEHVQQFRPTTNQHNVQQNLRRSKSNKFLRFPGEFWGLTSKSYAPENLIFKRLPPFLNLHITRLLKDKGEMKLEPLMELLVEKLKVKEVQLDAGLESMVQKGKLCISDDGMVSLPAAQPQK